MITIKITEEVKTTQEMIYLLENICQQIENGNTSGYYPHWELIGEEEENKEE